MYLSSWYVQKGQKARCGAIYTDTVLKIMPLTWFLKTTLAFPLAHHNLNHQCQLNSILDAAAKSTTACNSEHGHLLSGIDSAKSLLLCICRSCMQVQPLWLIRTTEKLPCRCRRQRIYFR